MTAFVSSVSKKWGIFNQDGMLHVVPCTPDGEIVGGHVLSVACYCAPYPDSEISNVVVHKDDDEAKRGS